MKKLKIQYYLSGEVYTPCGWFKGFIPKERLTNDIKKVTCLTCKKIKQNGKNEN